MKGEPFVLREGFWRNEEPETKGLPRPCARPKPFVGQRAFLAALSCVENHDRTRTSHAKGWSDCRCCGCKNGSAEFKLNALGATWAWPAGYAHYVSTHNVRPSLAFQEWIIAVSEALAKS